jgi:prepilin-type N-terminal cleavage/methylation domain
MNVASRRIKAAFTLLEVMVAMFLLTIVVAAVYSSWNAVSRGSRVGLKAAAEVQRARIAMRTLEDALTGVRMFASDADSYGFEGAKGNQTYLSFVSKLPVAFPRGGKFGDMRIRRVMFGLEMGSDSTFQLVLRQAPLLMEMDIDEKEHPVVLAKNVKRFEVGFWDKQSGDWIDEWTQTNQLPSMVRVTLEFGEKGFQPAHGAELTRVVALPSVAVPTTWQRPGAPNRAIGNPPR